MNEHLNCRDEASENICFYANIERSLILVALLSRTAVSATIKPCYKPKGCHLMSLSFLRQKLTLFSIMSKKPTVAVP